MHEIVIESLQRIHIAAEAFLHKTKGQKCFAFKGEILK